MQRVQCTLPLAALVLVGCQNQPNTLSNPFLAPDRVPPPSTRVLTPGAAQPYYPGDPAPSIGGAAPPYQPAPAAAPASTGAPPAGAWNSAPQGTSNYAPSSAVGQTNSTNLASGEVIRVPEDRSRLRFPPPLADAPEPSYAFTSSAPAEAFAAASAPGPASILPTPPTPPSASFPVNAGVRPAAYEALPQQVEIRAIAPARHEEPAPSLPDRFGIASSDGFRAQGSVARRTATDEPIRPHFSPQQSGNPQFGHGEQYEWLRGQLEHHGSTGQWQIRYLRPGEPNDPFGGRVVIANPQVLGNLEPGAFVVLQGQLHNLHYPDGRTLPAYQLTVVQRQVR